MAFRIRIRNPFKNPIGTLIDTAILPFQPAIQAGQAAAPLVGDALLETIGGETSAQRKSREAAEAAATEAQARTDSFNSAINDNTIDSITRQELVSLYQSGADSGRIAATLAAAREGRGIYGIRQKVSGQARAMAMSPGRRQLVSSLGSGLL